MEIKEKLQEIMEWLQSAKLLNNLNSIVELLHCISQEQLLKDQEWLAPWCRDQEVLNKDKGKDKEQQVLWKDQITSLNNNKLQEKLINTALHQAQELKWDNLNQELDKELLV